jgi:hypothetical protein
MDPELVIDTAEVRLHGLRADEQLSRDLAVLETTCDKLGDAPLRSREFVRRGWAEANTLRFASRLLDPARCTKPLEDIQ